MSPSIDLKAYFQRIGYEGEQAADLEVLRELQLLHTQAIPFENLNPLLGLPVKLDIKSLQQKLALNQRGGYCFEQNLLFLNVLQALGYTARGLTGRVIWNQPVSDISQHARTHMVLLITIDEVQYISDVGFGGQAPTGPLLLEPDKIQETPHEKFRLTQNDNGYIMQSLIKKKWKNLYVFDLQKTFWIDYKVGNWYTSTHPDSHFTTSLSVSRAGEGCRYALHNNLFVTHYLNGETNKQTLKNSDEICKILKEVFQLRLPVNEMLKSTLQKFLMAK
jgi:N-hydroxyarylamine O-acetyltransferase